MSNALPTATVTGVIDSENDYRERSPCRLAGQEGGTRRTIDLDLRILPGMGHLTTPGQLDDVVSLAAEVTDLAAAGGKI